MDVETKYIRLQTCGSHNLNILVIQVIEDFIIPVLTGEGKQVFIHVMKTWSL